MVYTSIGDTYRARFGARILKIPVATADNCPNRMGLRGMKVCSFCDPWGSAADSRLIGKDLREQIEQVYAVKKTLRDVNQFLVYFQAYTTTFSSVRGLAAAFETALSYDYVKGIVIATRPDCLSPALFDLINVTKKRTYVAVELGVQTFDDKKLEFLRRGHTGKQSIDAICAIARECGVDVGIHVIFGLPGEVDEDARDMALTINSLPIDSAKLHHLHVLKNTELENQYRRGEFQPLSLEAYAQRVAVFLRYLSPRVSIHRLVAFASRWDELVAPAWTTDRLRPHQYIIDYMKSIGARQGELSQEAPSVMMGP